MTAWRLPTVCIGPTPAAQFFLNRRHQPRQLLRLKLKSNREGRTLTVVYSIRSCLRSPANRHTRRQWRNLVIKTGEWVILRIHDPQVSARTAKSEIAFIYPDL